MELLAVIVLTSYFPILTFSFFKYRLSRKKQELEKILQRVNLSSNEGLIDEHVTKEYTQRDYYLPMAFVTMITSFGMVMLLAPWIIYGLPTDANDEAYKSVIFSGSHFWNSNAFPIEKRNVAVVAFAIMGSFIGGSQYIYRRFATIDLTPGNFFSVGMRMILSSLVTLIIAFLTKDAGLNQGNHILAMAFLIGLFPERGLRILISKVKGFKNEEESQNNRPLEAIEGISELHKLRLSEVGIDNVQNLANFDFFQLIIKTPFSIRLLLDWVSQAKLMVEFQDHYCELQKAGIRSVLDFIDAVKDGNSKPSRDHEKERIKQIAEVTGTSYMAMEVNYFNFVDDQSVKLLLHMRANLEVLTVKT